MTSLAARLTAVFDNVDGKFCRNLDKKVADQTVDKTDDEWRQSGPLAHLILHVAVQPPKLLSMSLMTWLRTMAPTPSRKQMANIAT